MTIQLRDVALEFEQATVRYTIERPPTVKGRALPKLYVQCIDAYRYQREWTLALRWEPGDTSQLFWESRAYRHPGVRRIVMVHANVAERLITEFLNLCERTPSLLFNAADDRHVRSEGFVHFHTDLLDGAPVSIKTLRACA